MPLSFHFLLALTVVYGTSLGFRYLSRYDLPVMVAEIIAGLVFGSVFGVVGSSNSLGSPRSFLVALALFGLLMEMFDTGLGFDLRVVRRNLRSASVLVGVTFLLPFVVGLGFALWLGLGERPIFTASLVGIAVSTTSVGLIYPLLDGLEVLDTDAGELIFSVTILDDVLSVAALAYAISLKPASQPILTAGLITGMLVVVFLLVPYALSDYIDSIWSREDIFSNPVKVGVLVMVVITYFMDLISIHAIIGAFFAGVFLAAVTHDGHRIERALTPVTQFAAPVFFFYVGMNFQVGGLLSMTPLVLGGILVIGLGVKVLSGMLTGAVIGLDRETLILLTAALPGRLSIPLAAAVIGLSQDLITPGLYDAFVILSVVSVVVSVFAFQFIADEQQSPLAASSVDFG